MNNNARKFVSNFRAFWYLVLMLTGFTAVGAELTGDYRVAAVIVKEPGSMVLIEDASGTQKWFEVGDSIGGSQVVMIDKAGATLSSEDGEVRLSLRGDETGRTNTAVAEIAVPASEQSKTFRYVSLISSIEADTVREGESRERAISRTMNTALGLTLSAQITAIDRVAVSTAAEARVELRRRLSGNDPVRVSIENDDNLKVLYLTPDQ